MSIQIDDPIESVDMTIGNLPAIAERLGLTTSSMLDEEELLTNRVRFERAVLGAARKFAEDKRAEYATAKQEGEIKRFEQAKESGLIKGYDVFRSADGVRRALARLDFDDVLMAHNDPGLLEKKPTCFSIACRHVGVDVDPWATCVDELSDSEARALSLLDVCKVYYVMYSHNDPRNHVEMVTSDCKTVKMTVKVDGSYGHDNRTVAVTSMQTFFDKSNPLAEVSFYAPGPEDEEESKSPFVGTVPVPSDVRYGFGAGLVPTPRGRSASVHDEAVPSGSSNITGGVKRSTRRVVRAKASVRTGPFVAKAYNVSGVTMFNNVDEMFLDSISREHAQEIIDELFKEWNLPTDQPSVMAYAEDMLWLFMAARTASNKADYNAEFEVPLAKGSEVINFSVLSVLLSDKFGVTRRNFSRGIADCIRGYLSRDENKFIVSRLVTRAGADPQMGTLCFDGSTHCTGLTSAEVAFTKTLESRNLFERDDVIAEGASGRLFQGMSGGVRSVVPR